MSNIPSLSEIIQTISSFDGNTQREIVESVVSVSPDSTITNWNAQPLMSANSIGLGTLGFARVSATLHNGTEHTPWSVVLKAIDKSVELAWGEFATPQREIEAYRSGFLADVNRGLHAATCYRVEDRPDGTVWLWLQDLSAFSSPPWEDKQFILAARHIGQFNGSWLADRIPSTSWFGEYESSDRRRLFMSFAPQMRTILSEKRDHPLVVESLSSIGIDRVSGLIEDQRILIEESDSFPRSVAHGDCHARNLFADHQDPNRQVTYGIDWASIFVAPPGIDAGAMVGGSLAWKRDEFDAVLGSELEIFESYVLGLQEAGWDGEIDSVRRTYLSAMAPYITQIGLLPAEIAAESAYYRPRLKRWEIDAVQVAEQVGGRLESLLPVIDEMDRLASTVR